MKPELSINWHEFMELPPLCPEWPMLGAGSFTETSVCVLFFPHISHPASHSLRRWPGPGYPHGSKAAGFCERSLLK